MNRVSLDERLRALDPTRPVTNRIPLMGMTLQGFVNLLKDRGPDYKQEAYRLLRCTDADGFIDRLRHDCAAKKRVEFEQRLHAV